MGNAAETREEGREGGAVATRRRPRRRREMDLDGRAVRGHGEAGGGEPAPEGDVDVGLPEREPAARAHVVGDAVGSVARREVDGRRYAARRRRARPALEPLVAVALVARRVRRALAEPTALSVAVPRYLLPGGGRLQRGTPSEGPRARVHEAGQDDVVSHVAVLDAR